MKKFIEKIKNINKKSLILIFTVMIVAIGSTIAATIGFNFDLKYQNNNELSFKLEKEYKLDEVEIIVKEVLGTDKFAVEKVGDYNDEFNIVSNKITEEQKNEIVKRINEKYETKIEANVVDIEYIPHNKGRDIVKPYILPLIIMIVLNIVYMVFRYKKLGVKTVLLEIIVYVALVQINLFGLIAICRIPIGRLTIPLAITAYLFTLVALTTRYEKHLNVVVTSEEKKNKKSKKSKKSK